MNPTLIKGLLVAAALAARLYAGMPVDINAAIAELSMLLLGSVAIKRPGDKESGR